MLITIALANLAQAQRGGADGGSDPFSEHVAFTGFFTRNLSSGVYVREIKLVDFSGGRILPVGFGVLGTTFADNGQGNDLVAGDGLYTSTDTYAITAAKAGNPVDVSVSASNQIVVDESFQHDSQLESDEYRVKVKVKCKIKKCRCPCGNMTCPACEWWGWSCIEWEWCEIEVEF